jgi:ureidoacrylate peracid hydrolase
MSKKRWNKFLPQIEIRTYETALLIIDMQNDFIHEKGKLSYLFPEDFKTIITPIKKIIKVIRTARIPVIYVKMVFRPDFSDAGKVYGPSRELGALKKSSWGSDIIKELKPCDSDYIVEKHRHSAFYSTDLELLLRGKNIKTLIIVGGATNVCVESTVRDAQFRDFNVIVVEDCTASMIKEMHKASLLNIKSFYGNVLKSNEVINIIKRKVKQNA